MKRRDFLISAATLAGLASLPAWAQPQRLPVRILVLLELAGGNDGLNTLIPFNDPVYRSSRPTLAIDPERVVRLTDALGLHPALAPLQPIWDAGELALIQGVGYEQPNRSHFRSVDIWNTASNSQQNLVDGWLASPLKALRSRYATPIDAIVFDGRPQPVEGTGVRVIGMTDPESFVRDGGGAPPPNLPTQNMPPSMRHLLSTWENARLAVDYLAKRLPAASVEAEDDEGGGQLQRQFGHVARLIELGLETPVYKVSLKGFDTHAEQAQDHASLLAEVAQALAGFRKRMIAAGLWDQVLVASYSEFGRRVQENGSQGTDHGAASTIFALGGSVKGGLRGTTPSLTDLAGGDLRFHTDFRAVYTSILKGWFDLDPALLPNGPVKGLDLFA